MGQAGAVDQQARQGLPPAAGADVQVPQQAPASGLVIRLHLKPGYLPQRKARTFEGAPRTSAAYQKLVQLGDSLVGLIRRSKGRDNKTLAAFAEALRKILDKFEF